MRPRTPLAHNEQTPHHLKPNHGQRDGKSWNNKQLQEKTSNTCRTHLCNTRTQEARADHPR